MNKLCKKAVIKKLNKKSGAKIIKMEKVIFKIVILNKVNKYREMIK